MWYRRWNFRFYVIAIADIANSIRPSDRLSVPPSIRPPIPSFVRPSVHVSDHPSVQLSIRPSIHPFIPLPLITATIPTYLVIENVFHSFNCIALLFLIFHLRLHDSYLSTKIAEKKPDIVRILPNFSFYLIFLVVGYWKRFRSLSGKGVKRTGLVAILRSRYSKHRLSAAFSEPSAVMVNSISPRNQLSRHWYALRSVDTG